MVMVVGKAREVGMPLMKLIRLKGFPILEQLHLEERLLRTSSHNWCLINDGTNSPAIVMGLSGKLSELVEVRSVLRDQIPVIKRFTGGGTVIVDQGTVFVTLICNKDAVPHVQPFPRSIMEWSGLLYGQVFEGNGDFHLRENDYVFGNRKFGGNAQSITKQRWVHHTSFLWDYEIKNMSYLKFPAKTPKYRLARDHTDFVCRMKEFLPRSEFMQRTIDALGSRFSLETASANLEDLDDPFRKEFTVLGSDDFGFATSPSLAVCCFAANVHHFSSLVRPNSDSTRKARICALHKLLHETFS
ncbi:putative lipoate-protein ligase A [Senna tora]|uniref:Putative lipoate-protein ligase A n=1 Tax=Senna tora TaxID=362788 RepID=A0A834WIT6_9FABA|nr:putative lipoate-protein ligase A [Senna tora]